ncbi:YggT family protein [Salinibacterium xinjiangense]|uniref:YggT family protein n=1 Tax=Salinibacterium xinjiangense TaxID=386302 RepID=A0A2C8ZU74_9MICO|nr:YggT family protein [Salinibacterium xinjiangense]GGL06374.1 YggT family protein [Salinibacterium xinjiangense]SOE69192.1 YggT family protein [Salinibacterium xinjiangense]
MTTVSPVSIIALILTLALTIFIVVMWARFILDLARTFARRWRPQGFTLVIAEAVFVITDPPIKLVRRGVPPLRIGGAAIDFSWSIVMLAAIILNSIVGGFI